jgi:hypothetical protein
MKVTALSKIEVPGKRNVGWLSNFAARNDGNEVENRMAGVLLPCIARLGGRGCAAGPRAREKLSTMKGWRTEMCELTGRLCVARTLVLAQENQQICDMQHTSRVSATEPTAAPWACTISDELGR